MDALKHVFGLENEVANNVLFSKEGSVVFAYGNHVVLYQLDQKVQKFIQVSDVKVKITAMAVSLNKLVC